MNKNVYEIAEEIQEDFELELDEARAVSKHTPKRKKTNEKISAGSFDNERKLKVQARTEGFELNMEVL